MSQIGPGKWVAILVVLALAATTAWWLRPSPPAAPTPATPLASTLDTSAERPAASAPAALRPLPSALTTRRNPPLEFIDVAAGAGAPDDGPLVVGLHGRGDTARAFSRLAPGLGRRLAWRFLRAPVPWQQGYAWFSDHRRQVPEAEIDSALAALDDQVQSAVGQRPVALFGFSQGCMMILRYLAVHPGKASAAVCVGGAVVGDLALPGGPPTTPILFVHGVNDQVVPVTAAKEAIQAMENRGFHTEFIEHGGAHQVPTDELQRIAAWLTRRLALDQTPPPRPD